MTIIVAVSDNKEGRHALAEAVTEARQLGTDLVAVNLTAKKLDVSGLDIDDVELTVVDGEAKGDPADTVLEEITERGATRLVIGVKRRTPVGKAILGSVSQRLLLHSPVPVLAVKLPEEPKSSAFDNLPGGMIRVTG